MTIKRGVARTIDNRRLLSLAIGDAYLHPFRRYVPWEGHGEHAALHLAGVLPGLTNIQAQPFTIRLVVDGRAVRYTPDFELSFRDGPPEVWEVKNKRALLEPSVQAKLAAAALALAEQGKRFKVFESGRLTNSRFVRNVRLLRRYVHTLVTPGDISVVRSLVLRLEQPTLGQVANQASVLGVKRAAIYRLLYDRKIHVEFREPITERSILSLAQQ